MLKKLHNRRGSGVIEFLGLMPLVILIALAVWQFAIVGYGIINTQAAARDGVRVAATKPDEANILKTVRTSFGKDTKYYRLDNVDINNDGVDAKVTVNVSFFTVLLPNSVIIPFQWKATAPIYSDKAQVNVTSSNGSLPEGPPSGSLPEVGQSNVNLQGVALPNVSLASSANNGVQPVQSNGQETKSWSESLKDTVSNARNAVTETLGDAWEWTKAHKEEIASGLTVAAGVGLLFVPGGQALGAAMLIGAALGGGVSALAGNDAKTIMRDISIGGMAGAASVAVAALASVGVASTIGRIVTNPAVRKFIPFISGSVASGAGGSSYSVANDLLHEQKVNWKNAAITGALAMTLTVGGAYVLKQGIPALGITQQATSQRIMQVDDAIGANVNRVVGVIPGAETQIAKMSSLINKLGTKPIPAPAITQQVANQTIKQGDVVVGTLGEAAAPRLAMNLQLFAKGADKDVKIPAGIVSEGQTAYINGMTSPVKEITSKDQIGSVLPRTSDPKISIPGVVGKTVQNNEFSILKWDNYPSNIPKPEGPFRLVEGAEYDAARKVANQVNRSIHATDLTLRGMQIHEVQPVNLVEVLPN